MNMKIWLAVVALLSMSLLPVSTPSTHADGEHKPQHGGQFVEVDGHHGVEMVANDTELAFHLSDHNKPMDLTGASFRAIVQTQTGTTILKLAAKGAKLTAVLETPIPPGTKIALSGKAKDGHAIQARFVKP